MDSTQVIILAAGKGKRMESDLPKALTPFLGKPFIRHVIEHITPYIVHKPIIVVGHKRELVTQELGDAYTYVIQEEQLGTGHAVAITEQAVPKDIETVIVLFSDQPLLRGETIKKLLDAHTAAQSMLTMAVAKIPDYDDWRGEAFYNFGRIFRDTSGAITRIVEAKDATEEEKAHTEVNPAYFAFNAPWLWSRIKKLSSNNVQKEYYLTDLVKIAFEEGETIASVDIDPVEALGANTKEQLALLESIANKV